MNLSQIRQEVELLVQDVSYAKSLDSYINQALIEVCDLVALPSLKVVDVVTTEVDKRYISLSTSVLGGFSGRLRKLFDSQGRLLKVYPDLEAFITDYPLIATGSVEAAALECGVLWYANVPAEASNLTVVYYKNPTVLEEDSDIPDCLPESLHRKLLIHGAAFMIFDQIEDGAEGAKVNTLSHYYHSLNDKTSATGVKSGVQLLREYVGGRRSNHQSSVWRY